MTYVRITDHSGRSIDQGSCPDSVTNYIVVGENQSYDLSLSLVPERDKSYFVLFVIYTTGDSCCTERGRIAYVDLYDSYERAAGNARRIRKHDDDGKKSRYSGNKHDRHNVLLLGNDGVDRPENTSRWTGYFEEIEEIRVAKVRSYEGDETWTF